MSGILEMKGNEDGFHCRMRSQSRTDDDDDDDEGGGLGKKERPTFSDASIFCYLDVEIVPYPSHFDLIVFRPCPFDVGRGDPSEERTPNPAVPDGCPTGGHVQEAAENRDRRPGRASAGPRSRRCDRPRRRVHRFDEP